MMKENDVFESHHQQASASIATLRELLRLGLTVVNDVGVYRATDWVASVHAADIDNDGEIELLLGSRDGSVRALTKHGDTKWKRAIDEGLRDWVRTVVGLPNPAEKLRVVAGARKNVYALDKSGEFLWAASTGDVVRHVWVCDVNGDGRTEVLAGSQDHWVYAFDGETGREVWRYPTLGWIRTICPCDIDGDGEMEVLAGSGDKHLYVIDGRHGQYKQTYTVGQKIHALFAGDVDADGAIEMLLGTNGKDLYALKPNGREKWRMHPPPDNRILSLCVADINNDGRNEIIAGSEDMHVYFLDDRGKLLWRHYLGSSALSVYALDIDRDGLVEILIGAQDSALHVLRVDLAESLEALRHEILTSYKCLATPFLPSHLSQMESALLEDLAQIKATERPATLAQAKRLLRAHQYTEALSVLLRLKQQHVQPFWKKSKNIGYVRTLCLVDTTQEEPVELIVGTDEGEVQALNTRGEMLWSRPLPDQRITMLQVADLDGDGAWEVIACTYNRRVYVLNDRGKFLSIPMQEWISCIYVYTLLLEGRTHTEIVIGSQENKITVYNSSLEVLDVIPTQQGIKMVCAYDLNNDGKPEIVAGTFDQYVYVYSRDGSKLWEYQTWDRVNALQVKDIDGDGLPEILVGSEDRNIHILDRYGHLKWRYYTPHRVLDVDAYDVDQDGQVEVLIGDGDGYLYVLSGQGDLLWKYKMNDRVRVVRAGDVNNDGHVEIVLGSEDRLNIVQVVRAQGIDEYIEQCWSALCEGRPARAIIADLHQHPDAHLRAFTLWKLAGLPDLGEDDVSLFDTISKESSFEERLICARVIPLLFGVSPSHSQRLLSLLATDPAQEVRLAVVECLPTLAHIDPQIGFEWLKRFTRNSDRHIQHAVVRNLTRLIPSCPEQVFPLLVSTVQEGPSWVQQESARALAHYCGVYTEEAVICAFTLLSVAIRPAIVLQVAHSATNPVVQRLFQALFDLLEDTESPMSLVKLKAFVQVFGEARALPYGEIAWQLYRELSRAAGLQSISEIASYSVKASLEQADAPVSIRRTFESLHRLAHIARVLRLYLKREALLDRLTSLIDVDEALKHIANVLSEERATLGGGLVWMPDRLILQSIVRQWRNCVLKELSRLRGKADLHVTIERRLMQMAEQVSIPLIVLNSGHSPAVHVEVKLRKSNDFVVIGSNVRDLDSISSGGGRETSFLVKPLVPSPQLVFDLQYTDAEAPEKVYTHSERVEMQSSPRAWTRIRNPYNSGTPIRDRHMFYGRQEDLRLLQESLSNPTSNSVVVLSGQRRSGKTSLLYQLMETAILEPHIPVFIDMHAEGLEFTTVRFFFHIAQLTHKALKKRGIVIDAPDLQAIKEDPTFAFRLFLEEVQTGLQGRKLILLIDEFEILEEKVKEVAQEISKYFRSLIQHGQGISMLLSGTRKMRELTDDSWSVLFNIARQHRLSRLNEREAIRLITEPVQQELDYDASAVKEIRRLAADQPYFIHLLCGYLVDYCNTIQHSYVTQDDVNAVLDRVVETCHNHFMWLWNQCSTEGQLLLSVMAEAEGDEGRALSMVDIEDVYRDSAFPYERERLLQALENLMMEEIVEGVVAGESTEIASARIFCHIPAALARLWLRRFKPLKR